MRERRKPRLPVTRKGRDLPRAPAQRCVRQASGSPARGPADNRRLVALRHHASVWVVPAILLIAALFPWPYGYYGFLRLAVFVVSAWIAYEQWRFDDAVSGWVVASSPRDTNSQNRFRQKNPNRRDSSCGSGSPADSPRNARIRSTVACVRSSSRRFSGLASSTTSHMPRIQAQTAWLQNVPMPQTKASSHHAGTAFNSEEHPIM